MSDAKDALIAWAYREIERSHGLEAEDGIRYPSRAVEFFEAARTLVPDVDIFATQVHDHADIAVRQMLEADDALTR